MIACNTGCSHWFPYLIDEHAEFDVFDWLTGNIQQPDCPKLYFFISITMNNNSCWFINN